jgi:outer membrane protein TolC
VNVLRRAVGLMVFAAAPAMHAQLTLEQAVAEASEHNAQIRIANARERQAVAAQRETRGMWLPHVDLTETVMSSSNPVFVFGSLLEQGRFSSANFDPRYLNSPSVLRNYRVGLNVRYTVFDQFRRLHTTRQAANGLEQSSAAANEVRQAVRVEVVSKFYGLLVAQARRDAAVAAVKTAEADGAAMRAKFEQGLIVESDALATEVQLASFRQREIEAAGGVNIARAALNAAIGRDVDAATTIQGELPANPASPTLPPRGSQTMSVRGEVRAAELATANARLQLQSARGSMLPRIDTFGSWGASGNSFSNRNGDRTIGAVVTLDLFDGGKFARVTQAAANVEQARASEDAARSRVELEIVSAAERARSAAQRIEVARAAVAHATAAARIVRDRYEQGLTTITEHLRAQQALFDAQLDLLAARYDSVVSSAELARATGDLNDVNSLR